MAKLSQNNKIRISYFFVAIIFGIIVITIALKAIYISSVEGDRWRKIGAEVTKPNIKVTAPRGNIYSNDGQLMATTEYTYRLYIDFWADGLSGDTLKKYIEPLSVELAKMFPEKTASQYRSHIMSGWNMRANEEAQIKNGRKVAKKSREYKLFENNRQVNFLDLKAIRQMPFLKQNKNKSGLITKPFVKRTKPFGTLASRTIGDIYGEFEKGGKNGLELEYDSLLRGVPGTSTLRKVNGRIMNVIDIDPIQGKDIISTIDIDIQDITEKALLDKLREIDAESGTAVVMEVSTGEIKAITNMGRVREGVWTETKNHAVADEIEPGSTFKVASMIVALEDGVVTPNDTVDAGNGKYPYANAVITDHNANKGGCGRITASKAIRYSSNIGVAKIILKGYSNNPEKYVEGLYKLGFNENLELEIPGAGRAKVRMPKKDRSNWSKTALPWMSFGYETQVPPIYTLAFFNAIANDGKFIKPIFVKEIQQNGKTEERKKTKVIRDKICSDKTLREIREMLYDVVNQKDGTGKPAHSDFVEISGKTGTAQISQGAAGYKAGGLSHQVSFCGFFPSKEPKYSFIVVIRKPRNGYPSGGTMSGAVCKAIAEGIVSKSIKQKVEDCPLDSLTPLVPKVKYGLFAETEYVMDKLDISYKDDSLSGKWFTADIRDNKVILKDRKIIDNLVPNVVGMGAKDALYLLENSGLKVNLAGKGTVFAQTITPGARVVKGQTIGIQLK